MRVLILDYYYPVFLRSFYRSRPDLAGASFEEHRVALRSALFGETAFEVEALRALGHEADDLIVNAYPLRQAWAHEHDLTIGPERRWRFRTRRGSVPWLSRLADGSWGRSDRSARIPWLSPAADETWMWSTLLSQVRDYRPDVVHIACMDFLPDHVVADLAQLTSLVIGQVATELPPGRKYSGYDLVISSIPNLVDRFRDNGIPAEFLPLAFEPRVRAQVAEAPRDIPISFVGSFSRRYSDRVRILESVARATPLQTWTADVRNLPARSPIRRTVRGLAFGEDMYRLLGRSLITINSHGTVSGRAANNLRLYEATGMGALLLTDSRVNLGELFDVGRELIAFRDPQEAGDLAAYYLEHPEEAAAIAEAGQRRTLRDHTWTNRMRRLSEIIGERL